MDGTGYEGLDQKQTDFCQHCYRAFREWVNEETFFSHASDILAGNREIIPLVQLPVSAPLRSILRKKNLKTNREIAEAVYRGDLEVGQGAKRYQELLDALAGKEPES